MRPEENGAVKNSEDRWRCRRFCVAKCFDHDAAVADRFAKQSSEYDAAATGSFA